MNKQEFAPEEQAKMQKERVLSDAEILKGGAEYVASSEGGFRLEGTPNQYIELHREMELDFSQEQEKQLGEMKEEILKELAELPIEEIIQMYPELAEKFEAIRLEKDGREVSLFRKKGAEGLAFPVWSKPKDKSSTMGRIILTVPAKPLPEGMVRVEFSSICACCGSETYGLESPFRSNHPEYPKDEKAEGESERTFQARHNSNVKMYETKKKEWEDSEECKKDKEWHEQKKREFSEAMQSACSQNGIKSLVMRKPQRWTEHYGDRIKDVSMIEVTDTNEIQRKMRALEELGGKKAKLPDFEIRG